MTKDAFDKASTHKIREHFRNWSDNAPEPEQGPGSSAAMSQRYHYCIQVDAVALESILSEAPSDPEADRPFIYKGFVNLIWKDWEPDWPSAEDVFEPLEGNTAESVGWMRVHYSSCYRATMGYFAIGAGPGGVTIDALRLCSRLERRRQVRWF